MWSPDGQYVAVNIGDKTTGESRLVLLNAKNFERLPVRFDCDFVRIFWSPDSRMMAGECLKQNPTKIVGDITNFSDMAAIIAKTFQRHLNKRTLQLDYLVADAKVSEGRAEAKDK